MNVTVWAVAPPKNLADGRSDHERATVLTTIYDAETLPPLGRGDRIQFKTKRYTVLFIEWDVQRHHDEERGFTPVDVDYYVAEVDAPARER